MWTTLRAVSLDLDDTLWHVEPVLERAEASLVGWLNERYPRLGALHTPTAARTLRAAIAAGNPAQAHDLTWVRTESLRRLAREADYPHQVADEAFAVFHAARNEVTPYAEVPAALAKLSTRYPLYALSNGNADVARTPLGVHFRFGVSAGEAGAAKPDPRIFAHLLARAGIEPESLLHAGDDPLTDVAGGRAVGCRTAWVNRDGRSWPPHLPRADIEVADLEELAAALGMPNEPR